ncbi:hypothetical protein Ancab_024622 [Ancistrocladus abbreviatus]
MVTVIYFCTVLDASKGKVLIPYSSVRVKPSLSPVLYSLSSVASSICDFDFQRREKEEADPVLLVLDFGRKKQIPGVYEFEVLIIKFEGKNCSSYSNSVTILVDGGNK